MLEDFTVVGDPHVTKKSEARARRLFAIVESLGRNVFWTGDLLDTKEIISGKCLNLFFDYFKSSKLNHIIIVGNHDYFNLQCLEHSLHTLSALPNVRIIDKIEKHPKLPFIFFPYIHDKVKLKEELDKHADPNLVLIGHFEVSGFDFGNGHLCEDGKIVHEDFAGYKRVISGHFHKLQQTGNFTYIGSPFSHSFGEANQDKVLGHYNSKDDTLELIPTDLPQHISTKIDMSKKNAEAKLAEYLAGNENNLIRIQLYGSSEDVAKLDKSKYQEYQIKWVDNSESSMQSNVNLDETLDNKSQFMEWAKNIKSLDATTIELGISILESVNAR